MAKFYQHPVSGNAIGVAACLDYAGYEHEKVFTDIMKGEQMTPEYIAMNPYHTIPTLQTTSGFSMWEGNSIMRYVAGQCKPELMGSGAETQAMVNLCLDLSLGGFYKDGADLAYPVYGFAKAPEGTAEDLQKKFKVHMDVLFESGKFVKDGSFMCGESLTIADFRMWGKSPTSCEGRVRLHVTWIRFSLGFRLLPGTKIARTEGVIPMKARPGKLEGMSGWGGRTPCLPMHRPRV